MCLRRPSNPMSRGDICADFWNVRGAVRRLSRGSPPRQSDPGANRIDAIRSDTALAAVAQARRYAVDGQLDAPQHLRIAGIVAVLLQQLDLNMVQRIEIGETVLDRAFE